MKLNIVIRSAAGAVSLVPYNLPEGQAISPVLIKAALGPDFTGTVQGVVAVDPLEAATSALRESLGFVEAWQSHLSDIGNAKAAATVGAALAQARTAYGLAKGAAEVFPGGTRESILQVSLTDLVGDYDTPDTVPEWQWIEREACFSHLRNGEAGIWEFQVHVGSVACRHDMPSALRSLFNAAVQQGVAYIVFHQGT